MKEEEKTTNSRRRLLKTALVGSGAVIAGKSLPENWSRPVVDAISLPAHAQTSPTATFSVTQVAKLDNSDSMFARLIDTLVPNAQANGTVVTVSYCVTPTGTDTANFTAFHSFDGYPFASFSATDVKVGEETSMTGVIVCNADAGDWLDSIGLIKDAAASAPQASVLLTSITLPVATGYFNIVGEAVQQGFNASPGPCASPDCSQPNGD